MCLVQEHPWVQVRVNTEGDKVDMLTSANDCDDICDHKQWKLEDLQCVQKQLKLEDFQCVLQDENKIKWPRCLSASEMNRKPLG